LAPLASFQLIEPKKEQCELSELCSADWQVVSQRRCARTKLHRTRNTRHARYFS
jgi:hypothetical protein